jgi:hypothetical protein
LGKGGSIRDKFSNELSSEGALLRDRSFGKAGAIRHQVLGESAANGEKGLYQG